MAAAFAKSATLKATPVARGRGRVALSVRVSSSDPVLHMPGPWIDAHSVLAEIGWLGLLSCGLGGYLKLGDILLGAQSAQPETECQAAPRWDTASALRGTVYC
jgi:hypothetical protein